MITSLIESLDNYTHIKYAVSRKQARQLMRQLRRELNQAKLFGNVELRESARHSMIYAGLKDSRFDGFVYVLPASSNPQVECSKAVEVRWYM